MSWLKTLDAVKALPADFMLRCDISNPLYRTDSFEATRMVFAWIISQKVGVLFRHLSSLVTLQTGPIFGMFLKFSLFQSLQFWHLGCCFPK